MKKLLFLVLFIVQILQQNLLSNIVEILSLPIESTNGIAGESSVVNNNAFNVVTNPALLLLNKDYFLEYNRLFYFGGTYCDNVGLQIGNTGIGIVVNRFSSGTIEIRDIDGVKTNETFEYSVTTINTGLSTVLNSFAKDSNLYGGICGYIVWEKINFDKKFYGGNLGIVYDYSSQTTLLKTVRLGVVIKGLNITKNLIYHSGVLIQLGILSVVGGYESEILNPEIGKIKTGLIFNLPIPSLESYEFKLGLGYSFAKNSKFSNFSTGNLSIKIENVILGYSFTTNEYLGNIHSIQLSLKL